MIRGIVTSRREPVIDVTLQGPSGVARSFPCVVDTGFTDFIALPQSLATELGLHVGGTTEATLGDNQVVEMPVCRAAVMWHGRLRPVIALISDGGPFLGMALLDGSRLIIDARENGLVSIESLAS